MLLHRSVASGAEATATPPQAEQPIDGVLVLNDGGILSGRITRVGDRYIVVRAASEFSVPAQRVASVCSSLEEAYYERRQQAGDTAEAHLALAAWCLRHELLPQAARELIDARGLDPRHPQLALLERRLTVATNKSQSVAAASTASISPTAEPNPQATTTHPTSVRPFVPASQLRTATADLPDGALDRFVRKVQPVLVNNCTTSGCHQLGGEQPFQLDRALLHGVGNRRSTTRNLAAALTLVDHEQPDESLLLIMPRRAHGGMSEPLFGPRQEQLMRHLEEWVMLVTGGEQLAGSGEQGAGSEEQEVLPVAESQHEVVNVALELDELDALFDDLPPLRAPQVRRGAAIQPFQPRDSFDSEIFNRLGAD